MPDFMDVLNKKATDIEKPKPRPIGTYVSSIVGLPKQRTVNTKDGERAILAFSCKPMFAKEDVDQEQLAAQGDISAWPPLSYDIWVDTPEGEWQLTQFLTNVLGIEAGDKTLGEMCTEAPGKQLLTTYNHRPFVNKSNEAEVATQIAGVAKA